MSSSRVQGTGNIMNDAQFQQLLAAMTTGINPTIVTVKFSRTPDQASITDVIYYSLATWIKLWKEATQFIPIKFKIMGG